MKVAAALLVLTMSALAADVAPRTLERAGILPPRAMAGDLADAQDRAVLDRTLYGRLAADELDARQSEEMVAAARRMFDRRIEALERQRRLVDQGAAPRLSIPEFVLDVDQARRVLDLAEERAALVRQLAEMARLESEAAAPAESPGPLPMVERFAGAGVLLASDLAAVARAFQAEFSKAMPVSARGDTAFHRALGFDHRGRIDVALDPDQPEGAWLLKLLRTLRVPYFAFRGAVAGKASGRHIHIGPPSERLRRVRNAAERVSSGG